MRSCNLAFSGVIVGGLLITGSMAIVPVSSAYAQQSQLSYSEDIAPIFRGWCVSCHQPGGEGYEASRLDLRTYQGLMEGTKFGPMVIAGKPDESNLIVLLAGRASPELQMPRNHKPLPTCLRQNIWRWIFQGAKDN
jgi:mono/diheme cytochrome c family protein